MFNLMYMSSGLNLFLVSFKIFKTSSWVLFQPSLKLFIPEINLNHIIVIYTLSFHVTRVYFLQNNLQCGHSNHERQGFIFTLFVLFYHLFYYFF